MTDAMRPGAVTFLDVLGWKGIWSRDIPDDAVRRLKELVKLAEEVAAGQELLGVVERGTTTEVKSISDTIVLQTAGPPERVLRVHAAICQALIPKSIEVQLPLRGAAAYGEFLPREEGTDTIVVGPAVDEAASWHEATDWIGVMLTPSAILHLDSEQAEEQGWVAYPKVPLKRGRLDGLRCVDWTNDWTLGEDALLKAFREMGPLVTEIAAKYMNTLSFYRARAKVGGASASTTQGSAPAEATAEGVKKAAHSGS